MTFSLGIDAGGTYTDAVLIQDEDGCVVESGKALTTYPDPITGIKNAMKLLDPEKLKNVSIVSLSTTLSTNTILENKGFPVGLIMVGEFHIPDAIPASMYCVVAGGHDSNGEEICPLDIEPVRKFARSVQDKVAAFAVSSLFSTRNADHELFVKKEIFELTGLPVVCGHELSQDLGAYERAVTAFLNAQLIPITYKFTQSVVTEMKASGMNATLLMLKCDGSVVGIDEALEKPIETIFSGPAASLMGAAHLSGLKTCAVIDIGGTSTDVALIQNGLPEMDESGAVVGGWSTRVKAIRMETMATGGDSHVFATDDPNQKIHLGPIRVMPLCRAAILYPGFLNKLKDIKLPPRKYLSEFILPSVFYIRTGFVPMELTPLEKTHYAAVDEFPASWSDLFDRLGGQMPLSLALESLVKKRLIQPIGFTPTDALHILGDYTEWDQEAALTGAEKMERLTKKNPKELALYTKNRVAKNMSKSLIEYLVPGIESKDVEKILSGEFHTKFSISVPIILIGGPSKAYVSEIQNIIEGDVSAPKFSDVGNAVGALTGKGVKRLEIIIKENKVKQKGAAAFENKLEEIREENGEEKNEPKNKKKIDEKKIDEKKNEKKSDEKKSDEKKNEKRKEPDDLDKRCDGRCSKKCKSDCKAFGGNLAGKEAKGADGKETKNPAGQEESNKTPDGIVPGKMILEYLVFHDGKRTVFKNYSDAYDFACAAGQKTVLDVMKKTGLKEEQIEINFTKKEIRTGTENPIETKITFVGVETAKNEDFKCNIPDFVKFINPEKKYREEK
ncbi:hydantoinase/oxoprolinase family protein [Methanolapillus ohkumae]